MKRRTAAKPTKKTTIRRKIQTGNRKKSKTKKMMKK